MSEEQRRRAGEAIARLGDQLSETHDVLGEYEQGVHADAVLDVPPTPLRGVSLGFDIDKESEHVSEPTVQLWEGGTKHKVTDLPGWHAHLECPHESGKPLEHLHGLGKQPPHTHHPIRTWGDAVPLDSEPTNSASLPCHVVSYGGENTINITARDREKTPLITLTPDQAEEVAGYLLNHARNVRANMSHNTEEKST